MEVNSQFSDHIDTKHPLQEYPRPQFRREQWMNLNGMWEYQVVQGNTPTDPNLWKPICVPYALGTRLSGADHILQPGETLWYRRVFSYKPTYGRTMMNFEGVDQNCVVYLNGFEAGRHYGGYAPFSIDVSSYIKYQNALMVKVIDLTDHSICAYGKQRLDAKDIWYPASSGIWGTVWIEEIPEHSIDDIKITPDYDEKKAYIEMAGNFDQVLITVIGKDGFKHEGLSDDGHYVVPMENFHPWSVEDPFLYDIEIRSDDDVIYSYFGMRKFSYGQDSNGKIRFCLNNEPLFLSGVLDQGYFPESKYTYPTEEAMEYEIDTVKSMGFNMVRKHVKQENRRWYHLCDTKGLLVMQDMPNGGNKFSFLYHQALPLAFNVRRLRDDDYTKFGRTNQDSRKMYQYELDAMLDTLYNCVCIFSWVPFNEGWGQFDSSYITDHIQDYDTTRLVDSASGWHDQGSGDFNSRHVYFHAFHVPVLDQRVLILSEFGGYTYLEWGHSETEKTFGYKKFKDKTDYVNALYRLYESQIIPNIKKGLSGCIYTQLTDCETECNGLLSADRRIVKVDQRRMKRMNERIARKLGK